MECSSSSSSSSSSSPPPPLPLFRFLLLALSLSTITTSATSADAPSSGNATIYDLLPMYGLPPGIFPDTVTSFSLSEGGSLSVNLSGPCQVEFDYLVSFDATITGVLRYGVLDCLKGIQARRFLIWFDIDRIKVDLPLTNYIYFDVGWITRKLGVDQFLTIHSCKSSCRASPVINGAFQWAKDFITDLF
ncbi:hypothetical protein LUZ63_016025 [Rhynchospora breviuscula]|uniref:Uncharacterized protein n=1 Tax=Rhynchospora breviuscula TaxID=2022672 RepID=A0A9Q0CDI3_9POAL|nr:hypothetical protein LUZ63_016025 [Rhynchospora breviuscula]